MQQVIVDLETYKDYFLAGFKKVGGGYQQFEMYEGLPLDIAKIKVILKNFEILSFNGNGYDIPVLAMALEGATNIDLKRASDTIITEGVKSWEFERRFGIQLPDINHIDLIEVAPGQASLKIYGGRLHSKKMQDLPIEPDASITPEQRVLLRKYNCNDLDVTEDLAKQLFPQIELRRKISEKYGVDVRSKSDAQIAEAVIRSEVTKLLPKPPKKMQLGSGYNFQYVTPSIVKFQTEPLKEVLEIVQNATFYLENGSVKMPAELDNLKIKIGNSVYRMGIGGLHSSEEEAAHFADEDTVIRDSDVKSYYPSAISLLGLFPQNLTDAFLDIYRKIIVERLAAKDAGDDIVANTLKIVLNGSFGKFGSKYSILYSPTLLIQTTVTGQLCLLMLIERLEQFGISVVSANTDGVVLKYKNKQTQIVNKIIKNWEEFTGFEKEATYYKAIYSRDVNNYIAVKTDGKVKLKGAFAPPGLQKNPTNQICVDAVVAHLKDGTPLSETIRKCEDIRKFLTVRAVKGGAVKPADDVYFPEEHEEQESFIRERGWSPFEGKTWLKEGMSDRSATDFNSAFNSEYKMECVSRGKYLGKAVRWYYGKGEKGTLNYQTNGNTVAKSEGAIPMMDLVEGIPEDLDYDWYIREAESILMDIGAVERPEVIKPPRKNSKEWKALLEEGKIALDEKGKTYWVST